MEADPDSIPDPVAPSTEGPITVALWAVPLPLARPVMTPAGTFDTYHHLVVLARSSDGHEGWGLAAGVTGAELDATVERAEALLAATGPGIEGLVAVEAIESTRQVTPPDRWSRWAACALATAGWDLAARRAGQACADIWGRSPSAGRLPCYASGLFLGVAPDDLGAEAAGYRRDGFRAVKMRTGLAVNEDLERLAVVRRSFPEPGAIAVDSVNAWTPEQAIAFADAAGPLLWVEDPVAPDRTADVVEGLGSTDVLVAAGESLIDADELVALRTEVGIGAVLLDVQQVGGPRRFLETARRLRAAGARVGAHIFTPISTHLLACVDEPLPVEVFDWSDALWRAPLAPGPDGMVAVTGPGFGVELDHGKLHRLGTLRRRDER